ncbi:MAG TPA: hypothetical protein VEQ85_16350 [Lacipirellulaceae bacterium]|nr:hypothetical protein [Lacipirellulaceae bacterium]
MKEFEHLPSHVEGDPLAPIVDAFVELPVPAGPDAASRRRLAAAMHAADQQGRSTLGGLRSTGAADFPGALLPWRSRRRWIPTAVRQATVLAAAIALVAVAALWSSDSGPATRVASRNSAPSGGSDVASAGTADVDSSRAGATDPRAPTPSPAAHSSELSRIVERFVAEYLRTHGEMPDARSVNAVIATVLRDNPELAGPQSWRAAQERLTYALEKPEVIGLGMGLLGTLPWTTYGRF